MHRAVLPEKCVAFCAGLSSSESSLQLAQSRATACSADGLCDPGVLGMERRSDPSSGMELLELLELWHQRHDPDGDRYGGVADCVFDGCFPCGNLTARKKNPDESACVYLSNERR